MITLSKNLLLTGLLATAGTALAMECAVAKPQAPTILDQLSQAVRARDFESYFALLSKESQEKREFLCELQLESRSGKKAVHFAAEQGNTEALRKLLELGAAPDSMDGTDKTPFMYAAEKGHMNVLALLVEKNADTLACDRSNMTALHWAAVGGHVATIEYLVRDQGLDVNAGSYTTYTPLHCAAQRGHISAINTLIAHGAQKNKENSYGISALHLASIGGHTQAVLSLIKDHGFDPNAKDRRKNTSLHYAAEFASKETVKALLENGARRSHFDDEGFTALHRAIIKNRGAIIVSLITDHGFNPMDITRNCDTTLALAKDLGCCISEFALVCAGAQMTENEEKTYGQKYHSCLLSLKSKADRQTQLDALVHESLAPWNPNVTDSNLSTPLMEAAKKRCLPCTKMLLKDKRTDPNMQDKEGKTALHYAIESKLFYFDGHGICACLLNLQRIKVGLKDKGGNTAWDILHKISDEHRSGEHSKDINKIAQLFALRKMRVQLYLALKNARCSEQCSEKMCLHAPLPADICMKVARLLTEESLPKPVETNKQENDE